MADIKSKEMVKIIADALNDKKAEGIKVIDISNISVISDYFVIANGSNPNQIQALVDNVEEKMHEAGYIELTGTGREIAEKMYERHKTLSSLLERMGVPPATAVRDACRIEHVISEESFDKIKEYMKSK